MNIFLKLLKYVFIFYLVPFFLIISIVLTSADIRHILYRGFAESPAFLIMLKIRKDVHAKNFKEVAYWLNKQLDMVKWVSKEKNYFLPGLIKNTEFVLKNIYHEEELTDIKSFLEELVKYQPDLLPARLWYSKALSKNNDNLFNENLEYTYNIATADPRIYRIALNNGLKVNNDNFLREWCEKYLKSNYGGPHFYDYITPFFGLGLRSMVLEIEKSNGEKIFIPNNGLKLNNKTTYEFSLNDRVNLSNMRLIIGNVSGISLDLKKITFYKNNDRIIVNKKDIDMSSRHGFFINDKVLVSTNNGPEVLNIYHKINNISVDMISLEIVFKKLDLISTGCEKR